MSNCNCGGGILYKPKMQKGGSTSKPKQMGPNPYAPKPTRPMPKELWNDSTSYKPDTTSSNFPKNGLTPKSKWPKTNTVPRPWSTPKKELGGTIHMCDECKQKMKQLLTKFIK